MNPNELKNAEDWASDLQYVANISSIAAQKSACMHNLWLIKQIQLNAYKAGMSEAAEIANYSAMGFEGDHYISAATQVEQAILSARDQKTMI